MRGRVTERKRERERGKVGVGPQRFVLYISVCVSFDSGFCRPDRRDHITVWRNTDNAGKGGRK